MEHSLLSQFQGSLLGISLGLSSRLLTDELAATAVVGSDRQLESHTDLLNHQLNLILSWTNSLVSHQRMVLQAWQQVWQNYYDLTPGENKANASPQFLGEIAALPMMLLLHDNSDRLRQQLQTLSQCWQVQSYDTTVELLAFGQIITELLTPSTHLNQLIPNILTHIPIESQLAQQLTQVQSLLQQKTSLTTVISQLKPHSPKHEGFSSSLALAIYCFLSTPRAFSLSVQRAMRIYPDSNLIPGIVGALSGTYNGLVGIPMTWQLKFSKLAQLRLDAAGKPTANIDILSDQQILNQATQLFQVWAGLYCIVDLDAKAKTSLIVAAPGSLLD